MLEVEVGDFLRTGTDPRRLPGRIDRALYVGDFRAATVAIRALVDDANRLLAAEEPWWPDKRARAGTVLATLARSPARCLPMNSAGSCPAPRIACAACFPASGCPRRCFPGENLPGVSIRGTARSLPEKHLTDGSEK